MQIEQANKLWTFTGSISVRIKYQRYYNLHGFHLFTGLRSTNTHFTAWVWIYVQLINVCSGRKSGQISDFISYCSPPTESISWRFNYNAVCLSKYYFDSITTTLLPSTYYMLGSYIWNILYEDCKLYIQVNHQNNTQIFTIFLNYKSWIFY